MRICQQCRQENDDTRVFCRNCGARLPAAAQPDASQDDKSDVVAAPRVVGHTAPPFPTVHKRKNPIRTSLTPTNQRNVRWLIFRKILFTIFFAAILACLIQAWRTPDRVPPPTAVDPSAAAETFATLRESAHSKIQSKWIINSHRINQFLASTIQMKPADGNAVGLHVEFQRVFVILKRETFDLCIEQKLLGHSVYFSLAVKPTVSGTSLQAELIGGACGRLPIHSSLNRIMLMFFRPTLTGLEPTIDLLQKADSIKITSQDVTLQWPASASSAL